MISKRTKAALQARAGGTRLGNLRLAEAAAIGWACLRGVCGPTRGQCAPDHRGHSAYLVPDDWLDGIGVDRGIAIRAYIQRSRAPVAVLAEELGVSETTIRRSRLRTSFLDRSHTPKNLKISLSAMEEALVCELRSRLWLPLDDITEVMRRCVNGKLSRSAIHRCLVRHNLNQRPKPDKLPVCAFEQASVGFIHIDLKHLPALEKRKSYAFVAIDRTTRYVYLEIHPKRDAITAAAFLKRFLAHFPYRVHTILTDNGSEFTDRFAVDMKNKPHDRPSGRHPFDRLCAEHTIEHR